MSRKQIVNERKDSRKPGLRAPVERANAKPVITIKSIAVEGPAFPKKVKEMNALYPFAMGNAPLAREKCRPGTAFNEDNTVQPN